MLVTGNGTFCHDGPAHLRPLAIDPLLPEIGGALMETKFGFFAVIRFS